MMALLQRVSHAAITLMFIFLLAMTLPHFSHAQDTTSSDLSETIRSVILADPRAAALTSDQIDAMVGALTQKASAQGMTSQDILWRPVLPQTAAVNAGTTNPAQACTGAWSFLCILNNAFDLPASSTVIPISLGASLILLLAIVAAVLELRHRTARAAIAISGNGTPPARNAHPQD